MWSASAWKRKLNVSIQPACGATVTYEAIIHQPQAYWRSLLVECQNRIPANPVSFEFVLPRCFPTCSSVPKDYCEKKLQAGMIDAVGTKSNAFYWKHKSVSCPCRWNSSLMHSWIRWHALRADWPTGVVLVNLTSSVHKQSRLHLVLGLGTMCSPICSPILFDSFVL